MTPPTQSLQAESWNRLIATLPGAHFLQTWEWGEVKARYGWKPTYKTWQVGQSNGAPINASAMILQRTIPAGGFAARMRVLYIPKGPLLDWSNPQLRRDVLDDVRALAQKSGAIFIKIDPDVQVGTGILGSPEAQENSLGKAVIADLRSRDWRYSDEQIQFRNTILIDLNPTEDELLARMKQKTRYNIRLASRKGVTIRVGSQADLELLYRMYAETSLRDGFVIRDESYYRTVWESFLIEGKQAGAGIDQPVAEPLIAEIDGEVVAAVIVFRFAGKAWYLYGMSRPVHRDKMPNHLLQWEAMRRAKAAGCSSYDLWGAPEEFSEKDPLWGVYRFKEGFGGTIVHNIGAWDLPVQPILYKLYTQLLPRLLGVMRRRGMARTSENIGAGNI